MRLRRSAVAAVILALAAAPACLRILPRDRAEPPAAAVERHVLCAAVAVKGDWAEPGPDAREFARGPDAAVHSFLELRGLRGVHAVSWRWYDPSGAPVRAAEPVAVGEEGKTYDRYIAWDRLRLPEDRDAGEWTAAVFIDGALASARGFRVR